MLIIPAFSLLTCCTWAKLQKPAQFLFHPSHHPMFNQVVIRDTQLKCCKSPQFIIGWRIHDIKEQPRILAEDWCNYVFFHNSTQPKLSLFTEVDLIKQNEHMTHLPAWILALLLLTCCTLAKLQKFSTKFINTMELLKMCASWLFVYIFGRVRSFSNALVDRTGTGISVL